MGDKEFLQWFHDRQLRVHNENANVDYMHKLRAIIAATPEDRITPNVVSTARGQTMDDEDVERIVHKMADILFGRFEADREDHVKDYLMRLKHDH